MFKNLKLVQKICLLAVLILSITLCIQASLLLKLRSVSMEDATWTVNNITDDFSVQITQSMSSIENDVLQLSEDLSYLIAQKKISRPDAIKLVENQLSRNKNVVAMGVGFEPNAFDANDTAFKNQVKLGSDASGRFLAYITKTDSGSPLIEPLTGYDVDGSGDWYLKPKNTGKPFVTEPYLYTVNGKEITMFTIAYPIKNTQGKFIGTLTADIALNQMQSIFENNDSLNSEKAIAMLFTKGGQILSSTINPEDVNQIKKDDAIIQNVLSGKNAEVYTTKNLQEKGDYLTADSTIDFITGDRWHLVSAIPKNVILKAYYTSLINSVIVIAISLVIIFILILVIARSINQPIKNLMGIMKKVENGDLTESSNIQSQDEIGQLSQSFDKMLINLRHLIDQVQSTSTVVENSSEHLNELALQNAESISDVNNIIAQIAEANVRQAEDIENIVTRTATLGQMINENSLVIDNLDRVAAHTNDISNQGVSTLGDLDEKSNETKALSEEISKAVSDVNATISNIDNIAMLIDGIASQTNLLALNASIEAARAGEAGRGFSVVADEIRSLAEQTTTATKDIKQLISVILSKSEVAVISVNQVSKAQESEFKVIHESIDLFNEIIESFRTISESITTVKINSGTIENSKNDIFDALTNISALTEETTASTQEVTSTMNEQKESMDELSQQSHQLSQLTESLKEQVVTFRI